MSMSILAIRFQALIALCGFGVYPLSANNSNETVCTKMYPIKCPDYGTCCQLDQFCREGDCEDCAPKDITKDKLLINCREMTLKNITNRSHNQISCLNMCHATFTLEELNNYDQIQSMIQNYTDLLTTLKLEFNKRKHTIDELNVEIKDLKKRWSEISQILNQTIQNNTQVKAELNVEIKDLKKRWSEISQILNQTIQNNTQVKADLQKRIETLETETAFLLNRIKVFVGIQIAISVILVLIIIGMSIFLRRKQLKNKEVINAEMSHLIKSVVLRCEASSKDSELKKLLDKDYETKLKRIKDDIVASNNSKQDEMQLMMSENRRNEESIKKLTDGADIQEEKLNHLQEYVKQQIKDMQEHMNTERQEMIDSIKQEIIDSVRKEMIDNEGQDKDSVRKEIDSVRKEVTKALESIQKLETSYTNELKKDIAEERITNSTMKLLLDRQEEKINTLKTDFEKKLNAIKTKIKKMKTPTEEENLGNDSFRESFATLKAADQDATAVQEKDKYIN